MIHWFQNYVDNEGNKSYDVVPLVVDANTYVFGVVSDWWKMVAVDRSGKYIVAKYMSREKEFNIANWLTANYRCDECSVSDIKFCEQ